MSPQPRRYARGSLQALEMTDLEAHPGPKLLIAWPSTEAWCAPRRSVVAHSAVA